MSRALLAAASTACALLLGGCAAPAAAGGAADGVPPDQPVAGIGMCAAGATDCVDVVVEPAADDSLGEQPRTEEEALDRARNLLGEREDALDRSVRTGRRGDELLMLTEDYVLWRNTVELEEDASGVFRVVSVTVELPDGPQTVGG